MPNPCKNGSEKKPNAPNDFIISTGEVYKLFPKGFQRPTFRNMGGWTQNWQKGPKTLSTGIVSAHITDDFCRNSPEFNHIAPRFIGDAFVETYNVLINIKWKEYCQCKVPWKGGKCSIWYILRFRVVLTSYPQPSGTPTKREIDTETVIHGPITGIGAVTVIDTGDGTSHQVWAVGTNPETNSPDWIGLVQYGATGPRFRQTHELIVKEIVPAFAGQLDNCGDPPPEPPNVPTFPPYYGNNAVYYPPEPPPPPPTDRGSSGGGGSKPPKCEPEPYVTVVVPICTCATDGTSVVKNATVYCRTKEVERIRMQFEQLAAIRSMLCKIELLSDRSFNVLGGSAWFGSTSTRSPSLKNKPESRVKAQDPLTDSGAENELTARSLIDLLAQMTAVIYSRAGLDRLPAEVPQTLLAYTDQQPLVKMQSLADYLGWFVSQFDALIGRFPIEITVEDIDPATQGNQEKKIELPNISEALAELYGLNVQSSVNSNLAINFLMRLASEVIATKNSSLITQDYVKANAAFLGYKGNPARREINYSFDPAHLDSLDEFLRESKGFIQGWREEDSETIVAFLQRIVFSAGIIKAVFFRNNKQISLLEKEAARMSEQGEAGGDIDQQWETLLNLINNPDSFFNRDQGPQPRVRDKDGQQ